MLKTRFFVLSSGKSLSACEGRLLPVMQYLEITPPKEALNCRVNYIVNNTIFLKSRQGCLYTLVYTNVDFTISQCFSQNFKKLSTARGSFALTYPQFVYTSVYKRET